MAAEALRWQRVEHLRKRGSQALAAGDARGAVERYSEALQALSPPDRHTGAGGAGGATPASSALVAQLLQRRPPPLREREALRALLSNRSAASLAAGRHADALADADAAAAVAPRWPKPQWRRGRALAALGRWPEAAAAYAAALHLMSLCDAAGVPAPAAAAAPPAAPAAEVAECRAALHAAVARFTRQELADATLALLRAPARLPATQGQQQQQVHVPQLLLLEAEEFEFLMSGGGAAEQQQQQQQSQQPATTTSDSRALVLFQPESRVQTAINSAAVDTASATAVVVAIDPEGRVIAGQGRARLRLEALREAAFQACVVDAGPDAARAQLARWLEPPATAYDRPSYNGAGDAALLPLPPPPPHEAALARARLAARLRSWREARHDAAAAAALLARVRCENEALLCRQLVEAHTVLGDAMLCGELGPVTADSGAEAALARPPATTLGLAGGSGGGDVGQQPPAIDAAAAAEAYETALNLLPLPAQQQAGAAAWAWAAAARKSLTQRLAAARARMHSACWMPSRQQQQQQLEGDSERVTRPALTAVVSVAGSRTLTAAAAADAAPPVPLELPLALPYAQYRLVTATGAPVERPQKHPFGLTRVTYDSSSSGGAGGDGGVWFEPAGGAVRWRQTASTVEVIALQVPSGTRARSLCVDIRPQSLRVADAATGRVYLEGALARAVSPADSVWVCGGGPPGPDGCVVTLSKLNLELYAAPRRHSASWWPRLFLEDRGGDGLCGGGDDGDRAAAAALADNGTALVPAAAGGALTASSDATTIAAAAAAAAAEVADDDAPRDYSDLPPEIEALRLRDEARDAARRTIEARDRRTRVRLEGLEGARRRARAARLEALRRAWCGRGSGSGVL